MAMGWLILGLFGKPQYELGLFVEVWFPAVRSVGNWIEMNLRV